jgi:hypothetical protein
MLTIVWWNLCGWTFGRSFLFENFPSQSVRLSGFIRFSVVLHEEVIGFVPTVCIHDSLLGIPFLIFLKELHGFFWEFNDRVPEKPLSHFK